MNLPFQKYIEEQANRILSGDRTTKATCFATSEDFVNIKELAQNVVNKGLYVRVEKRLISFPYEEIIYCFIISNKQIEIWQSNPSFDISICKEIGL